MTSLVTKTQVWPPIAQKASAQDVSFDWKGICALFRRLATWGRRQTLVQKPNSGFCLAQRYLKGFNQLRERSGL